MVEIMEDLHQYIPTNTTTSEYQTCGSDSPMTVTLDDFHYILFGKKISMFYYNYTKEVSHDLHV